MPDRIEQESAEVADGAAARKAALRKPLLLLAPVAVIIGILYFYLSGGRLESTDNASLQTGQVSISANVSGQVIDVEVEENQRVRAGQILFRIRPDTYLTAVAEAEAQLATARTDVGSMRADYRQKMSDVQAAQAQLVYAEREAARQKSLVAEGISSQQQVDQAVLAASTAKDAIAAAKAKAESTRAGLSDNVDAPVETQPAVRRAIATLNRARIALNDTVVRAPQDGIVTRVHQLQVGSYVTALRPLFVMTGTRFWVQANFKESQLRHMRVGQPAEVVIDAFPDTKLRARVVSFSPGTGNSFALLPAENATGNWVKVVQRLPVELHLEKVPADLPLHAGLSAEVTVDTGHQRHLIGADTPPVVPPAKGTAPARP
ncbi:MAG TPA: HlyD family secretion protein [Sphingobium sp.]|uniref:HlyD family secretion protein n=1 Tax=Sphingobium sp. TaxID=1912891 RepID=UPI002ED0A673